MRLLKILIIVIALGAVALLYVQTNRISNDVAALIDRAAAGSETALTRLETGFAPDELGQHSNRIGAAIAKLAEDRPDAFDMDDPLLARWHQLYFRTDPLRNSSERTRINFVRSTLRFEPVVPDAVFPGQKQGVGLSVEKSMRSDDLDELGRYKLVVSIATVLADDREIWPEGLGSTSMSRLADVGKSSSSSATHLLIAPADTDPTGEIPITVRFDWSVLDEATNPPTEFASWTEEVVATRPLTPPPPAPARTIDPVEAPPGNIGFDQVQSLLDEAAAGDESAMEELITLGRNGELRPYANEIGDLLAANLRTDWRPRLLAHYEQHDWFVASPSPPNLPKPSDSGALLIALFYLAEPATTATDETWTAVAKAGVVALQSIQPSPEFGLRSQISIQTVTPLLHWYARPQVPGIKLQVDRAEFDGSSWPINMETARFISSASPQRGTHWRNYLHTDVAGPAASHPVPRDLTRSLLQTEQQPVTGIRTFVEISLMLGQDIALATWPVTIENPVLVPSAALPLDETTPDHR
jgi:hypothetical protein